VGDTSLVESEELAHDSILVQSVLKVSLKPFTECGQQFTLLMGKRQGRLKVIN